MFCIQDRGLMCGSFSSILFVRLLLLFLSVPKFRIHGHTLLYFFYLVDPIVHIFLVLEHTSFFFNLCIRRSLRVNSVLSFCLDSSGFFLLSYTTLPLFHQILSHSQGLLFPLVIFTLSYVRSRTNFPASEKTLPLNWV